MDFQNFSWISSGWFPSDRTCSDYWCTMRAAFNTFSFLAYCYRQRWKSWSELYHYIFLSRLPRYVCLQLQLSLTCFTSLFLTFLLECNLRFLRPSLSSYIAADRNFVRVRAAVTYYPCASDGLSYFVSFSLLIFLRISTIYFISLCSRLV